MFDNVSHKPKLDDNMCRRIHANMAKCITMYTVQAEVVHLMAKKIYT